MLREYQAAAAGLRSPAKRMTEGAVVSEANENELTTGRWDMDEDACNIETLDVDACANSSPVVSFGAEAPSTRGMPVADGLPPALAVISLEDDCGPSTLEIGLAPEQSGAGGGSASSAPAAPAKNSDAVAEHAAEILPARQMVTPSTDVGDVTCGSTSRTSLVALGSPCGNKHSQRGSRGFAVSKLLWPKVALSGMSKT